MKKKLSKTRNPIRPQDIADLKVVLRQTPSLANRVFSDLELARAMRKTEDWILRHLDPMTIAQSCLEVFPKAPLSVKKVWSYQVSRASEEMMGDVKVSIRNSDATKEEYSIPKEKIKKTSRDLAGAIKGKAKVETNQKVLVDVQVTEIESVLDKVRDAFILAPMGDLPSIRSILVEFGIIDARSGKSLMLGLTENEVRRRANQEDWRGARVNHLYTTFDVIPDEMRLAAAVRNFELHKMMYHRLKAANGMMAQYERSGIVKSIDGSTTLDRVPTLSDIAATAEVMRRMVDGSGNINILIQQIQGQQKSGVEGDAINNEVRKHMARLAGMNPAQLEEEVAKMERLRTLIHNDQIIDAEIIGDIDII